MKLKQFIKRTRTSREMGMLRHENSKTSKPSVFGTSLWEQARVIALILLRQKLAAWHIVT